MAPLPSKLTSPLEPWRRHIPLLAASACLLLVVLMSGSSSAADTQSKLDKAEKKIEEGQQREGVLTEKLDQLGERVDSMQAAVDALREAEQEAAAKLQQEIGRASCRERVCQYV